MFLSFMAISFPHDSVQDHDKEFSSLVCMIAVSGFSPLYDERGEKCNLPSYGKSALFIRRREIFQKYRTVLSMKLS